MPCKKILKFVKKLSRIYSLFIFDPSNYKNTAFNSQLKVKTNSTILYSGSAKQTFPNYILFISFKPGFEKVLNWVFYFILSSFYTTIRHLAYRLGTSSKVVSGIFNSTMRYALKWFSTPYISLCNILTSTLGHTNKRYSTPYLPLCSISNSGIGHGEDHYF